MQNDEAKILVTKEAVKAISAWAFETLQGHALRVPEEQAISTATSDAIGKLISEAGTKRFQTIRSLPTLVSWEVSTYCERVRIYPFVTKYREAILGNSSEMIAAWQLHSHSLRQNELYVLQERGTKILDFVHLVTKDLGLNTENRARKFQQKFASQFKSRLRDRHRVVHAHEKPSMMSRVADLVITADDITKKEMHDYALDLIFRMAELLPGDEDDPSEKVRALLNARQLHVSGAEEEASQMMQLFFENMENAIVPASADPGK
ncbi:hypothetical protein HFO61_03855 [Rhizobium leguminosarum]|uniref:hypothetical protein n=1 Tax=Rhizobium leguminosarum TaxID=384 RepID=UPI001C952F1B|nr:hypothetical protein [Rhizobium leguminosarum]MBY5545984.1 hypothetical protein [Rhizobium leguminosarum]